jgi:hypothetical protein
VDGGPEAVHLAFQIDQMEFREGENGETTNRAGDAQIAFSGLAP